MLNFINALPGAVSQGLIWGIMAAAADALLTGNDGDAHGPADVVHHAGVVGHGVIGGDIEDVAVVSGGLAATATTDIPVLGTSVTEYGVALGIDNFSGTVGPGIRAGIRAGIAGIAGVGPRVAAAAGHQGQRHHSGYCQFFQPGYLFPLYEGPLCGPFWVCVEGADRLILLSAAAEKLSSLRVEKDG